MHTTSQLAPRSAFNAPAYGLPRVHEMPLRLEPLAPDTFGRLVGRRSSASRVVSLTNHPRGALS
jgi:hypothetical protein